jgi:CheY-like chemotaxis protein
VLLVDLNMPRMNGIELVEALRQDRDLHSCIVFVLTTSRRDEDKVAAYDLNVAGYVVKEHAGQDFQRLIDMMQCYWRVVELP